MTEKPVPLSAGRNADNAFEPSQVEVEEDTASSSDDQLLKRFRGLVDENKEEIFRMHQLQANEYFRENLEELKEEEMPQIIELGQDGFYKGDLIPDYSNQVVGRSEKLKNLIDMQRFFEPYPDRRAKSVPKRGLRVTLTGSAGSGKTTILSRFAREATKGMIDQMKQEDHLVHQINCRELERHKKISVAEFLFKTMLCGLSKEQMEAGCQWMQKNPQKVTLIIDSLDTMGYSLQKVEQDSGSGVTTPDVILHGILTGKLFREAFVLTSSREYEIRDYKGDLRADKVLSLGGFKKESIKRLTIGFLGQEEGEKVVKKLEAYPRLMELCKTPVFLIFTIIGLKDTDDSSAFVPKSMAGVLVKLINCLSGSVHAHTHERYSDEECIEAINKMKGLAYNGTMEDKVLYTEEDLQNALLTKDEIIDLVLIIPGKVKKAQQILEKGFVSFFTHQTVAELFCALKICEKDLDDFRIFVTKELPKLRFLVIRQLVCGILQDSEVFCEASNILLRGVSDVEEKRQILRDILSEEFRESTKKGNRRGILELLHVIHESGDGGKGILPTEIEKIILGSIALVPSDTFALAGAIHNSSLLETLDLCKCELTPETIQALDNKLEDSALKMKELYVSWNEHLGVEGYSSLGRLGRRHEVHKLGIDFCEPNAKELDALDEGLGEATVEELDASLNIKMGTNGFASMGSLMKKHGVDKLEIRGCELKSEEVDAFDGGLGDAKVEELDVSHNENLGVKGFFSIGRFIRRHETNKLGLVRCKLKSEEVDSFDEGLEDAKLEKLDVSLNKNLGVKGLSSMGRLVGKHGVDNLEMRGCELKSEEVECFVEGLGDAKVKKIALSRQRLPLPMSAICKLLPKVTECLDLRWNMLGEGDRSYLQEKLNQLPQTNLKVEIAMIKDEVMAAISEESSQDFGDCIVTVKKFSAEVETSSKEVWVNDCVINFQEGCFNDTTTVNGSLVIDKSKWPPGYFLITPIIHLTADTELVKPVAIKASSWGVKDQDDVFVDVLRLPSGSSTWEIVEKQPLTCNKFFRFDCSDFSPVAVGLPVELLDSVLFNIDVCLYATKADNFSTTFSLGDEEVLTKVKENMAQSNFELKDLFNIKAKNDDKLKCCLSTVKPIDFSLIPDANFLVTVDEHLLTMHTHKITTSQLDSDRFPGKLRRAVLRFEIYRNGKIVDHPFGFSHDYRSAAASSLEGDAPPPLLLTLRSASSFEKREKDSENKTPSLKEEDENPREVTVLDEEAVHDSDEQLTTPRGERHSDHSDQVEAKGESPLDSTAALSSTKEGEEETSLQRHSDHSDQVDEEKSSIDSTKLSSVKTIDEACEEDSFSTEASLNLLGHGTETDTEKQDMTEQNEVDPSGTKHIWDPLKVAQQHFEMTCFGLGQKADPNYLISKWLDKAELKTAASFLEEDTPPARPGSYLSLKEQGEAASSIEEDMPPPLPETDCLSLEEQDEEVHNVEDPENMLRPRKQRERISDPSPASSLEEDMPSPLLKSDCLTPEEQDGDEELQNVADPEDLLRSQEQREWIPDPSHPEDSIVAEKPFSAVVEPSGKEVRVNDCIINFAEGSFNRTTTVEGKLEIDRSKWPPRYLVITPMIYVKASSTLLTPASVQASSWCMSDGSNEGRSATAHVLHLPFGSSTWDVIKILPLTDEKFFCFDCIDFSPVCVGLPNDSQDSVLFKVDVCLYATVENTFTCSFCLGNELILKALENRLSLLRFELIEQFNSVDAKKGDKLKGCLSCVYPALFDFISDGDFTLTVDESFLTVHKQRVQKSLLICKQPIVTSPVAALKYEGYRNETRVDGHTFGYTFKEQSRRLQTHSAREAEHQMQHHPQPAYTFRGEYRGETVIQGVQNYYAGPQVLPSQHPSPTQGQESTHHQNRSRVPVESREDKTEPKHHSIPRVDEADARSDHLLPAQSSALQEIKKTDNNQAKGSVDARCDTTAYTRPPTTLVVMLNPKFSNITAGTFVGENASMTSTETGTSRTIAVHQTRNDEDVPRDPSTLTTKAKSEDKKAAKSSSSSQEIENADKKDTTLFSGDGMTVNIQDSIINVAAGTNVHQTRKNKDVPRDYSTSRTNAELEDARAAQSYSQEIQHTDKEDTEDEVSAEDQPSKSSSTQQRKSEENVDDEKMKLRKIHPKNQDIQVSAEDQPSTSLSRQQRRKAADNVDGGRMKLRKIDPRKQGASANSSARSNDPLLAPSTGHQQKAEGNVGKRKTELRKIHPRKRKR